MNKFTKLAVATLTVAAIGAVTVVDDAEARHHRRRGGLVLGTVIGLGIAGAIAHRHSHHYGYGPYSYYSGGYGGCYLGPVQCRWSHSRGREICWRQRYCD